MRSSLRTVKLKYLSQSGSFPSGNPRLYYKRPPQKAVAMPDLPQDHPMFLDAYARAAGLREAPMAPARTGTIGAGVAAFLVSAEYLSKSAGVKAHWRTALDHIRKTYGHANIADLGAKHIGADLSKLNPHPANNRLKVWRALCGWWLEQMMIASNPAAEVKRRKVPKSDGFTAWEEADDATFRKHWPFGSPERLAFELLHWTGARMCDAVTLSEGMVGKDGWLSYRQSKTAEAVQVPFYAPAPDFAEPETQAMLRRAIEARNDRHAVFITTCFGKPRSRKAASAWFARAVRAAGIKGKTAHGLRKRRGNILANNGASTHQVQAWLGHESLAMAAKYTKAADKRRMLTRTAEEQKTSNFTANVPKLVEK